MTGLERRPGRSREPLSVLVVDDSAVVRQILKRILAANGIRVTSAPDPIIAMQKIAGSRPDVIVLDLEMPRMDGLTFLRRLAASEPIPVVVCSSFAARGSETALTALEQGALDIVAKPRVGVKSFLEESATLIVDAVRAAHESRGRRRAGRAPLRLPGARPARPRAGRAGVLAIGASTGGTEALREIVEVLPPDAPGLVVVQHMPAGFTRALAERLNRSAEVEVREAESGDEVRNGRVLIAPGDRHMRLERTGAGYAVDVFGGPLVSRHRPSVDVLFNSVAQAAGSDAVGAILTGMGDDGARGLLEMRRAGAGTLAQSEDSCVVFGMPKAAIERGAVDEVVPLDRLVERLLARAGAPARGRSA